MLRAISSARHSGQRQRVPGAGGAPPDKVGIDAHQQSNGCVRAPQSKPRPQCGQRARPGVERASAAVSVMAETRKGGKRA
ncbi:hypothetical protein WT21_24970 [Burkholderia territorii]|nr:hypothetical protein WS97_05790 [Burkholderia territorii]KVQ42614.1 hypothetical protein WT21_24970 [Burkholderia territorii]KWA49453.1 hypothetical protein WT41_04950 [Burkholderia territorii]VWC24923.1 hypothetical protein BTE28158_06036 [Burkholderia territorii]